MSVTDNISWRFLKKHHRLLNPWHFETVIKCPQAPEIQPKPILFYESKHYKWWNICHGFNFHVTQHPRGQWRGSLVALTWWIKCCWHGRWHGIANVVNDIRWHHVARLWMDPIETRLRRWAKHFSAHHLLPALHNPYNIQPTTWPRNEKNNSSPEIIVYI